MRKIFHGYYPPTTKEFEELWSKGLLVPDTNVLLHLVRFMPKQREEVLAAFKSFGARLWLPHQVAKEFQEGWRSADSSNRGAYSKLKDDLAKKKVELEALIKGFSRFDPWPAGSPMSHIGEFFEQLSGEVDIATGKLPEADTVFAAVTDLFDGKVADCPNSKDIDARVKEAERRIQAKIPPGYMDKRPGDYLIWAEMKEKAKAAKLPILFVTDDVKEDWWLEQSGKTIGPRPELRQEFASETGQMFYAYPPARFLAMLADRTKNLVSPETVKEMERVEEQPRSPQLTPWGDRLFRLARETGVEPVEIQVIAQRIASATAQIELTENSVNRGGPGAAWLRDELIRWVNQAQSLLSHGEVKPEIFATSSDWAEFVRLVDYLTDEERDRLTKPQAPRRKY